MAISRLLYPLIIPLLILSVAHWLRSSIGLLSESYLLLLNYLPYALLIVIGFLCIQFNQLRSLLIAVVICVAYLVIQLYLQSSLNDNSALNIFFMLSTLLPILLILVSWFPERGVITIYGLMFLVILCLPVAVAIYGYNNPSSIALLSGYFPIKQWNVSVLAPAAIALYLLAFTHQITRLWLFQQPFDAAISTVLITLLINFALFDQLAISVTSFTAIQLIIIWSVLKQSHDMAYRDELTGLPGRRAFNEALKSPGRKYVIAMMDIDHFKKFNDKYGHDIGDDVLKVVANKMAMVTGGGKAYRFGGEEFTVLFKGKELETCVPHLQAVREEIAHYLINIREKNSRPKSPKEGKLQRGKKRKPKGISVTISIGVAKKTPIQLTTEQVLKAADKALYKAKKAGRNCLVADK